MQLCSVMQSTIITLIVLLEFYAVHLIGIFWIFVEKFN